MPGGGALVVPLAAFVCLLTAGCGDSGGPGSTAPASAAAPAAPTPSAVSAIPTASAGSAASTAPAASDAELCARIVAHWAREVLGGGTYGDYQSMGLSNGQYAILRDVVDAARTARTRQGAAAADRLIGRQARTACAARYRDGTPGGGPWQ